VESGKSFSIRGRCCLLGLAEETFHCMRLEKGDFGLGVSDY
jgi:hypothetical protein